MQPYGTYGNSYAFGNCTAYVASRIPVPSFMGNAMFWDDYLRSIGWRQGAPRRGAVAVTDFGWAGHVAVVEEVTEAGVVVSEMNYTGFNQIDTRLVSPDEFVYLY